MGRDESEVKQGFLDVCTAFYHGSEKHAMECCEECLEFTKKEGKWANPKIWTAATRLCKKGKPWRVCRELHGDIAPKEACSYHGFVFDLFCFWL